MVSFFSNFLSCTDTATLHDVIGMSVYLFIHLFNFLLNHLLKIGDIQYSVSGLSKNTVTNSGYTEH